jgi:CMP-N,N'-diacetyllegionaminic acid synthase
MKRRSVLGLIPARGGSKRLPRKNARVLGDKPLVAWSIECARASGVCDLIAVSTDDLEIAEIARRHGVPVDELRPRELSSDSATSAAVVAYEIARHRRSGAVVDTVVLLQPTSPFRSPSTIQRGLAMHVQHRGASVVSLSPLTDRWSWCRSVDEEGAVHDLGDAAAEGSELRRLHRLNGLLYVADADHVLRTGSLYSDRTFSIVVNDRIEEIDIDTAMDWDAAEAVIRVGAQRV